MWTWMCIAGGDGLMNHLKVFSLAATVIMIMILSPFAMAAKYVKCQPPPGGQEDIFREIAPYRFLKRGQLVVPISKCHDTDDREGLRAVCNLGLSPSGDVIELRLPLNEYAPARLSNSGRIGLVDCILTN
jgi:hypothetical protein